MNGILNLLKPAGMTSFDVVGYLRGVLKIKKIGHTGTLDPAAVGVLPICLDNGTKLIEYLTDTDKVYRGEMTLGAETDTQDSQGRVLSTSSVSVSNEKIIETFHKFVGKHQQLPPMYSAVKIDGKKLYELARKGMTVERTPRPIEIYSLEIIHISPQEPKTILFDVKCSKGTYIRTLCHDLGQAMGSLAHMSFLIRMDAGVFNISQALTLEEVAKLAEENRLHEKLISLDEVLKEYAEVFLNEQKSGKLINGLSVEIESSNLKHDQLVRIYNEKGDFFSVGQVIRSQDKIYVKSKKLFL